MLLFSCSVISNFVTPWTVTHKAPLPLRFFRQKYWTGLQFPSPADLPDSRIEPAASACHIYCTAGRFFTTEPPGKPNIYIGLIKLILGLSLLFS